MSYEFFKDFDEAIVLKATYERVDGEFRVRLVLKIYNTFGIANMFFKGDKIDKLFDNYAQIRGKAELSLDSMLHKEVFVPKTASTIVPTGLSFTFPHSTEFKGYIENSNRN